MTIRVYRVQKEADALDKILQHPSLEEEIEDTWWTNIHTKELHEPTDKHRLFPESEGEYPVYGGGNIHQYHYNNQIDTDIESTKFWGIGEQNPERSARYRVREKKFNSRDLKKAIYSEFGGEKSSKSQIQFVNELLKERRGKELTPDDVLLDCTEYRIAYRDIARATDERTLIATVLPKDTLCLHTLQTLKPYTLDPTTEILRVIYCTGLTSGSFPIENYS